MRRVALLGIFDGPNPNADLFRSRLGELGWVEHKTLIFDRRFTHADGARFAPLTAELLALRPDVFVAPFDTMATAAATATATVPIVFAIGTDPIEYGLVESLAHPGRNATGFSGGRPELGKKWLSPLKEAVPRLKVVDVLVGSRDRYKVEYLEEARRQLGPELVQFELTKSDEIDEAFRAFAKASADGVMGFPGTRRRSKFAIGSLRSPCPRSSCTVAFGTGTTAGSEPAPPPTRTTGCQRSRRTSVATPERSRRCASSGGACLRFGNAKLRRMQAVPHSIR